MTIRIEVGDCLDVLRTMDAKSVDAIITDPPYGLSFLGHRWDYDVPKTEVWVECLRVLKPGGHLLAFASPRTQHRMAVRIEDAGFEIRDMIAWVYGSGFPKSLDVSKAIDKAVGAERVMTREGAIQRDGYGDDWDTGSSHTRPRFDNPATAAAAWQGWGTALKPALEPITMARKPLAGTVAANVLAHGVGALNIEACRVPTSDNLNGGAYAPVGGRTVSQSLGSASGMNQAGKTTGKDFVQPLGRWPANLIHDGGDEVLSLFPQSAGQLADASVSSETRKNQNVYGTMPRGNGGFKARGDVGSAARFFYCAKANKTDRGIGNSHPSVKPTELMRYLCRLVTPPGGIVLDPFMGSGSTGKAALLEGLCFIGIELNPEYAAMARERIYPAWLEV